MHHPVAWASPVLVVSLAPCQVHYTGTLDDGTQFDSSRGRDPLEFTVGDNRVIKGFSEIVEGLPQGGSRRQRVSPESAYGELR